MMLRHNLFRLWLLAIVFSSLTPAWGHASPAPPASDRVAESHAADLAACAVPPNDAITFVSTGGAPFTAVPSKDGCWVFVGLASTGEIAAFRRNKGELTLQYTVPLHASPTGMVVTQDGQLLLAATGDSVTAVDLPALTRGNRHPPIYTIRGDEFYGTIYVNVTHDDGYLFVANERGGAITVVNLKQVRASGFKSNGIVGNIPAAVAPIAVTLSPDGKRLYSTSELTSGPLGAEWLCGLCQQNADGRGAGSRFLAAGGANCKTEDTGGIEVIDVARAEKDPAHSVLSVVPGGCEPVRLILSNDGATAYVTARGEDKVLAFDTKLLEIDPMHSLVGQAPTGTAPVGLAIVAGRLIVASSNRFGAATAPQHLTILDADYHTWGRGSVLSAKLRAGAFPREERLSPDGKTLYVTNFNSNQVEMVDLTRLPVLHSRMRWILVGAICFAFAACLLVLAWTRTRKAGIPV